MLARMKVREFSPRRLARARSNSGLTQADLAIALRTATRAKTTERNVRRWEAGTNTPHSALIPAIAEALGVTVDDLYGTDEEEADPAMALRRIRAELVLLGRDDLANDLQQLAAVRGGVS